MNESQPGSVGAERKPHQPEGCRGLSRLSTGRRQESPCSSRPWVHALINIFFQDLQPGREGGVWDGQGTRTGQEQSQVQNTYSETSGPLGFWRKALPPAVLVHSIHLKYSLPTRWSLCSEHPGCHKPANKNLWGWLQEAPRENALALELLVVVQGFSGARPLGSSSAVKLRGEGLPGSGWLCGVRGHAGVLSTPQQPLATQTWPWS